MPTKKQLRQTYKTLRQQLSPKDVEDKSLSIANRLLELPVWDKKYFHVFLPIASQNEVNTEYILHLLAGKDKDIVISKSDFQTREMNHYLLTDTTRIVVNLYGIPEPADGLEVPVSMIDVVFVPLLAYDTKGNRIGYGKGFYDKFLATCRPDTIKIGLSFFEPANSWEDIYESDVTLDYCVTAELINEFRRE